MASQRRGRRPAAQDGEDDIGAARNLLHSPARNNPQNVGAHQSPPAANIGEVFPPAANVGEVLPPVVPPLREHAEPRGPNNEIQQVIELQQNALGLLNANNAYLLQAIQAMQNNGDAIINGIQNLQNAFNGRRQQQPQPGPAPVANMGANANYAIPPNRHANNATFQQIALTKGQLNQAQANQRRPLGCYAMTQKMS
ncbi:unnamed protein product [Orchesella dallaii]|uniref:Uncharacterized protein n=1 Tax=Orchesella dallaii TaxID=48710 RepID=A0ABP1RD09_9HEXA